MCCDRLNIYMNTGYYNIFIFDRVNIEIFLIFIKDIKTYPIKNMLILLIINLIKTLFIDYYEVTLIIIIIIIVIIKAKI